MRTSAAALLRELRQELSSGHVANILLAAFFASVMVLVFAVADASLLAAQAQPEYLAVIVGMTLMGAAALAGMTSLLSGFRGCIAGFQEVSLVILAVMMAESHRALLERSATPSEMLSTTITMIVLATLLVGACAWLAGHYRIGRFIRYLPYPVVEGFLAGTGALLVLFALGLTLGLESGLTSQQGWQELVQSFADRHAVVQLLLCIAVAGALLMIARVPRTRYGIPVFLLFSLGLFMVFRQFGPLDPTLWQQHDWMLSRHPQEMRFPLLAVSGFASIHWPVIALQWPQFLVLALLSLIAALIKFSSLEIVLATDVDNNRELKHMGLANISAGLLGGMPGFHTLSITQLVHRMGAGYRLVGVLVAIFSLLAMSFAGELLTLMPRFVFGGMILWIGIDWLLDSLLKPLRFLGRLDVLVVVSMTLTVLTLGFLWALGLGLVASVVLFVIDYSRIEVIRQRFRGDELHSNVDRPPDERSFLQNNGFETLTLRLYGYLFFGTAYRLIEQIRQTLQQPGGPDIRYIVLDFERVSSVDASAGQILGRILDLCRNHTVHLAIASPPPGLTALLAWQTSHDAALESRVFQYFDTVDLALEWCEEDQLQRHAVGSDLAEQAAIDAWIGPDLGYGDIRQLMRYMQSRTLKAGEMLLDVNEWTDSVYFVRHGTLEVNVPDGNGRQIRIRKVGPGAILGEVSLYRDSQTTARIHAAVDCEVLEISRDDLATMLQREPRLAAIFHKRMAKVLANRLADNSRLIRVMVQA